MSSSPKQFYKSLNIDGKLLLPERPLIMGILNITPDSFYSQSRISSQQELIDKAGVLLEDGADILDIGAQSTRPGSEFLSTQEELDRLGDLISAIKASLPKSIISIDTFYAEVARQAIKDGASIINDISGGSLDQAMFPTAAELKVPYILTHMRGTPQTMQDHCNYTDVILDVAKELSTKINELHKLGVSDIIIDPGFGFAKSIAQNFQLLNELEHLLQFEKMILAGISRKGMIWKTLAIKPDQALNGTTALNMAALMNGAGMLRVHDVKEAKETVDLFCALRP